ncbi:hypothetical protein [Sphingomonas sp.]|uniref:hypothetical protein n=1 Tax=Sphingomonas sp. TaxID=28214 RepID=UPI002D806531|nr:hypothetical protein [Sphingomonas sp.]HEU0043979.1 hypothetical protein [Sphingomonas sp.]
MSDNALFYRKQADTERANADAAVLANVRERCERAASSWEAMASRAERTDTLRRQREASARPTVDVVLD